MGAEYQRVKAVNIQSASVGSSLVWRCSVSVLPLSQAEGAGNALQILMKIDKKKPRPLCDRGFLFLKPGDDLLSHGETPHYHRRCTVSLLSSEWVRWFQYSIVVRQTGVNGK